MCTNTVGQRPCGHLDMGWSVVKMSYRYDTADSNKPQENSTPLGPDPRITSLVAGRLQLAFLVGVCGRAY